MKVFGLQASVYRFAREARRLGALRPGPARRAYGGESRSRGRSEPIQPSPLVEAARAEEPPAVPGQAEDLDAGAGPGRRAAPARLPDVGPGQDRAARATARLHGLGFDRRPHHRASGGARGRPVRADAAQEALRPPLDRQAPLRHPSAQGPQGHRAGRPRAARHRLREPHAHEGHQALHRLRPRRQVDGRQGL